MKTPRTKKAGAAAKQVSEQRQGARAWSNLAYVQVASSELTRDINRDVVLERIRELQPISRVDLARACGLQPSTVSSIVEQLLRERWIREGAMIKTARGRRPTQLTLNEDLVILAADVRPTYAVVALIDLNGRFLERQLLPLGKDPEHGVATIAAVMQSFRERHPRQTFEGVGLSLPGRVDPETNRLLLSPNLPWQAFDIAKHLGAQLGLLAQPGLGVQLENAANATLLSELWFGRVDGIRNAVLLTVSEGVGVAILAEGQLIFGQHGMAGEFGHICLDPEGPVCSCGARGCWEVYASSRAALRYYLELNPKGGRKTFAELIAAAIDGDEDAAKALQQQAKAIGQGLHLLNAVLSPDVVLLVGDITLFSEMYRDIIERECRAGLMAGDGPQLLLIGDGEMARLRGAAAVVLQRHSGYYRAAHKRAEAR